MFAHITINQRGIVFRMFGAVNVHAPLVRMIIISIREPKIPPIMKTARVILDLHLTNPVTPRRTSKKVAMAMSL